MPDSSLNERRHERVPVDVTVRISTIDPEIDPSSGKPYFRTSEETCATFSRGGAFIVTHEPIAAGRRLLLELEIPNGPSIQTIGRVAWTRSVLEPSGEPSNSGFGVEFVGGSPEHLSQLQAFLDLPRPSRQRPSAGSRWKMPPTARHGGA